METIFFIGIFVLIVIIIGMLSMFNFKIENRENYENNNFGKIEFLDESEVKELLKDDKDGYFASFTIYDWKVRDVKDVNEYLTKILKSNSINELKNNEKERLIKLINEADNKLKKIKYDWFDGNKAANIKWKIGYTKGKDYEDGLPHTRSDVVMLGENTLKQNDKSLIGTLIHEKVHLYQKEYPEDLEKYKQQYGFVRIRRRDVDDRIRANPDTDEYIYRNSNGKEMKTVYKEGANGLEDTKTYPEDNQSSEHPNETMAIKIEKELN